MMIQSHRRKRPRRALTTVAVLVCLVVISVIAAALLKVGVAQRSQMRTGERRLQAEWLAESGLDRALAQLARNANYPGEKWSISAQELAISNGRGGSEADHSPAEAAATITITVDRAAQPANRRRIRVQADYGLDPQSRARHTKQTFIDLEPEKAGVAS